MYTALLLPVLQRIHEVLTVCSIVCVQLCAVAILPRAAMTLTYSATTNSSRHSSSDSAVAATAVHATCILVTAAAVPVTAIQLLLTVLLVAEVAAVMIVYQQDKQYQLQYYSQ
jgi:hypothetical protein